MMDVGIVLVNWHGSADTIDCLKSLFSLEPAQHIRIAVVDNASSDGSVSDIDQALTKMGFDSAGTPVRPPCDKRIRNVCRYRSETDPVREVLLITNQANLGFAAANNIGYLSLTDVDKPDLTWFLNNDTQVRPDTLSLLVARMASDPSIGICGCTLLYYHAPNIVQAYGGVKFSVVTARGHHIGSGDTYLGPIENADVEKCLTYVSGASMLVSQAFLDQVGLMCEEYFLYCEELDWAWRARGRFKLAVETAAIVYHKEGATIGTESRDRAPSLLSDFYQARNRLRFSWRHTPWCLPTVYLFLLLRTFRRLQRGHFSNAKAMLLAMLGGHPKNEWFLVRSS